MELKPGYKLTEVGVIPEDWEVKSLGNIARIQRGASPRPIDSPIWFSNSSSVGWVRISDVTRSGMYLRETEQKLSPLGVQHSRPVSRDTLIMSICATVGRPIITKIDICIHDGFVVFEGLQLEKLFIYYVLKWFEPDWYKHGQTGSQMNLNTDLINGTIIRVPPLPEQRAIATVLSDTDALIESLDRLIAKKRDVKQATMQQLLTGKTRLPGFSGKWEVKRLGDHCELITKGTTPTSIGRHFTESGINFLKAESILENGEPSPDKMAFIDEATHKILERSQLKDGDLLLSIAGVLGRVGHVIEKILPANTNQALAVVRLGNSSGWDRHFLFYCLRSPMTVKQIKDVNVQGAQANISLHNVQDLEIYVPPTFSEQTAIATVLSDLDAEIAALEARRDKTRALKQGMMQELLTGKTRLVKPEAAHG